MKQNNFFRRSILLAPFYFGITINSIAQTTTYGTGAGTAGAQCTFIGLNAGKLNTTAFNSFLGSNSGSSNTTGSYNSFFGSYAGNKNTTGNGNTVFGELSGQYNTIGSWNTFFGHTSGRANTTGSYNIALGMGSLSSNLSGESNTVIGYKSGLSNISGNRNTFIGLLSGSLNTTGKNNTYIGSEAGANAVGSDNIFIGNYAGYNEQGSNKLLISNSTTNLPLVYGEFSATDPRLVFNGKVGINTATFPSSVGTANVSNYGLFVKGGILTEEIRVRTGWADYVFDKNYKLMPLDVVNTYIALNKRLPNMPSAEEVDEQGLSLGDISVKQQEKIEELTLYIIELKKLLDAQNERLDNLEKK